MIIVYGPSGLGNMADRKEVRRIEEIEEPWRTYAAMMDAGKNEHGYWKQDGFGRREEQRADATVQHTIWYLFDPVIWGRGGI